MLTQVIRDSPHIQTILVDGYILESDTEPNWGGYHLAPAQQQHLQCPPHKHNAVKVGHEITAASTYQLLVLLDESPSDAASYMTAAHAPFTHYRK